MPFIAKVTMFYVSQNTRAQLNNNMTIAFEEEFVKNELIAFSILCDDKGNISVKMVAYT